jgi:hypothetical protein
LNAELTVLNSMAGKDFDTCLVVQKQWGLRWLDLRDFIYGHNVADLDRANAERARNAIEREGGLEVYCLSSSLMFDEVLKGEAHFRDQHLSVVPQFAETAGILKPRFARLIAGSYGDRRPGRNAIEDMIKSHPWVIDVYRRAIDGLADAGHIVTIENESPSCFLTTPDEVSTFFQALDRPRAVGFTWDIQNQWGCGVYPTVEQYEQLKSLIQYVHVKGGRFDDPATKHLDWNVALEEANSPIREIISRVAADGVSPVICINMPFHGQMKPGYDYAGVTQRDIGFMRTIDGVK